MMIRNRVKPFHLPKVRPVHLTGVFGEFADVVGDAIDGLAGSTEPFDEHRLRFYRFLLERVDAEKFGVMQETQLAEGKVNLASDIVKYIDPVGWFDSKLRLAFQVKLNTRAPVDILDIGTGPAHWPVVAEFFGHRVLGSDLPYRTTGKLERGHIYDALAEIYGVRRIPLKVTAFTPLPPLEQRYGMVTAFLAAFNLDGEKKPWTIEAWRFFLDDLYRNVLTEHGELFMSLADEKLTDEVWAWLKTHAVFANDVSKQIHFTDLSPFGV
jgi:hypothetical protein